MPPAVIENPILNSPFDEPTRHFHFDDDGITNEITDGRRKSAYFVPIAAPKKKGKQLAFQDLTADRLEENDLVNRIRQRVAQWRIGGYLGVTPTTARLLEHWSDPDRARRLFFCQREALETVIYITEVAHKFGDGWIADRLREANDQSNPGLPRMAMKMATGSGKTVVMAMLIAWQTLNKLAAKQDKRFSDSFLVIAPGITIRDRLRVLLPADPGNYYEALSLVPAQDMPRLGEARIVITNFHAFQPREKVKASKLAKTMLGKENEGAFTESPGEMVRRVCRDLGKSKEVIVLNDEAHHCYRRRPEDGPSPGLSPPQRGEERLSADDKAEAKVREEEARIWISGIEAIQQKIGVKAIYDLSATPFFLRGSGYSEGTLFPWVVSDFSLIDSIEAGIVKVPRVPVSDDAMVGDMPTYRELWPRIRDELPKKGRKKEAITSDPVLPNELAGALVSLYGHYKEAFGRWERGEGGETPPVFIVVCNNTNVSKLVFDWIAGWEKQIGEEIRVQAGQLELFRNDDAHGGWLSRPNTILVDSQQLESGGAMSADFKKMAAREIDEFKDEYRRRFPGRDADELTDEDLLREVMNTVGKPGKLGSDVRCVVSVSMLTEGWDANTVTHILGVRAFSTQLLCEQVVGRGLRRMSYAVNDDGMFEPEYAEVYGVPFSFIPTTGDPGKITKRKTTRVKALEERIACEIEFPRLTGYRYDFGTERLEAEFTEDSTLALSTADVPLLTESMPIVGEGSIQTLGELQTHRQAEVAFGIAKLVLEKYLREDEPLSQPLPSTEGRGGRSPGLHFKPWLFPQVLAITKRWMAECLILKDHTFPQLLLLPENAVHAAPNASVTRSFGQTMDRRP
ncbi:MAG: DEAD/DEAH box helicase family protein [Thermomicrobiales bacterium]|nr:DEAD/DEAH box helicase family protein [Thermomicrobiales bacterium]